MRISRFIVAFIVLACLASTSVQAISKPTKICGISFAAVTVGSIASLGIHQVISNKLYAGNPTDQTVVNADGASITAGTGASLPLQMRIRHHLQSNNIDVEQIMGDETFILMPDYFFPTNFPEIDTLSEAEVSALVHDLVRKKLETYDYVLIGRLPHQEDFEASRLQRLPDDHPVAFVLDILESNEQRLLNVEAINRSLAEVDPLDGVIVLNLANFSKELIQRGEKASELLPDRIHPNNNGQALFFNKAVLPGLDEVPALQGIIPEIAQRNAWQQTISKLNALPFTGRVASDFAEIAIQEQVQSAEAFQNRKRGLYWLGFASGQKANLRAHDSLKRSEDFPQEYAGQIAKLEAIKQKIGTLSGFAPNGFTVSILEGENGRSLVLNLAQALFYTSIELQETAPGSNVFEAYGYDFWASVNSENPPRVNYFFRAELDPNKPGSLNLEWQVLPLVVDQNAQLDQPDPLLRLGYLDPRAEDRLEELREDLPRLEFLLELEAH